MQIQLVLDTDTKSLFFSSSSQENHREISEKVWDVLPIAAGKLFGRLGGKLDREEGSSKRDDSYFSARFPYIARSAYLHFKFKADK